MADLSLLNVSYGIHSHWIVQEVSLSVSPGDWLCVAGCNGSGKSTLLRLMAGLVAPTTGRIQLGGDCLGSLADKHQKISILSQQANVSGDLTVHDLVQLGRYPYLPSWTMRLSATDRDHVDGAIDFVGLNDFRDRSLCTLSGGERQRAFLAVALAQNGSVLLLDEPTNHLDIVAQSQILTLMEKLSSMGKIIVSVFHDLNHISRYSSHLALMRAGRLLEFGPTDQVFQPQSLTAAFGLDIRVIDHQGRRCALY